MNNGKFTFGSNLVNHKGEAQTIASTAKLVGIYFSAHWCPPCRGFTPVLAEFYKHVNSNEKVLEIVFASSDKDEESFNEYFETMPWIALDFKDRDSKNSWSQTFGVQGIPMFVLLNAEGTIISNNARGDVQKAGKDMGKMNAVLKRWLED